MAGLSLTLCILSLSTLWTAPATAQWQQTAGPGRVAILPLHESDGSLFAGSEGMGVFRSEDQGTSWTAANAGIEQAQVLALASAGPWLFAGLAQTDTDGGVYRSSDGGASWTAAKNGMGDIYVLALMETNGALLAGVAGLGVMKTTDLGQSWFESNEGMGFETVRAFTKVASTLFAAGDNFLYRSDDGGASWSFTDGGQYFPISSLYYDGTSYVYGGGIEGLVRSTDGGAHWGERIDVPLLAPLSRITAFWSSGATLYASTSSSPGSGGHGVIRSTDHGLTWSAANDGIEIVDTQSLLAVGGRLIAGSRDKSILFSEDGGASWHQGLAGLPPGGSVRDLLAASSGDLYAGTEGDGVYRSTDSGLSWSRVSDEPSGMLRNETVLALASRQNLLFAGTTSHGIFRSSDAGASWVPASTGIPAGTGILSLASATGAMVAGTSERIYYSTDAGGHWLAAAAPPATIPAVAASGNVVCANVVTGIFQDDGIYRSTDSGLVWTRVHQSLEDSYIGTMAANGSWFYAGTFFDGGLLRSSDSGGNWAPVNSAQQVYAVVDPGTEQFTGHDASTGQAYRSTDHGSSWEPWNDGLPPGQSIEALAASPSYVFGATSAQGVWRRLRQGSASVEADPPAGGARLPFDLRVDGAMPFAGSTKVRFSLSEEEAVDMRIIDVSGRTVAVLASERLGAGPHEAQWDATGLPGGVYFCRLSTAASDATLRLVVKPARR
ncbi:MAG: T9SS type A sorting domain-containing protein [Candidatus Eisenbacteria bacterium]